MAPPTSPAHDDSQPASPLADYTSTMLQIYMRTLAQSSKAEILDVGPVCEENITYFAQRLRRFHVCDMFLRLNRNRRGSLPTQRVWEHLGSEPHRFDGINLWDFIDHLNDDDDVSGLLNLCHASLKPRGMMMVTSFEEQSAPPQIYSFVIKDGYRLTFRRQNHLDLPCYYRSNRIITNTLSEFQTIKSYIYRNGVREFLCRRE